MSQPEFIWDKAKAKLNLDKHRVSFEEAATVFDDLRRLQIIDLLHSDVEERQFTIGFSYKSRILVVVTYEAEEPFIRIISARRATTAEIRRYATES